MEKYKLRDFARWATKERLSDQVLLAVLDEMSRGLVGDRLGNHIYKKRIPPPGRGKRGGARSIVLFRQEELAVFLYGYSKSKKNDLEAREEKALRLFAKAFMRLSLIDRLMKVKEGVLRPIETR